MEIIKRVLAFGVGASSLYLWWHTNGLPNYVFKAFDIGRRSPLPDKFLGFISIILMVVIILCCMVTAIICFSYAANPAGFKSIKKSILTNPMIKERIAGLAVIAVGLIIWFLAYQIPEYTIEPLISSRVFEPLRTILGMTSAILMFVCALGGLVVTLFGGGLTLCPQKVLARR